MAGDGRGKLGAVQTGVLPPSQRVLKMARLKGKYSALWALRGVPPMTDLSGRESVAKHVGLYG